MSYINISIPWQCHNRDGCEAEGGWHLGTYWTADEGDESDGGTSHTYDQFSDGDHEDVGADELPTDEEHDAAWRTYAESVLSAGRDPLNVYCRSNPVRLEQQRWQASYRPAITAPIGGRLVLVRRGGRGPWRRATDPDVPNTVRFYFGADDDTGMVPADVWGGIKPLVKPSRDDSEYRSSIDHIAVPVPRSAAQVEREVKAAARRHLRNLNQRS